MIATTAAQRHYAAAANILLGHSIRLPQMLQRPPWLHNIDSSKATNTDPSKRPPEITSVALLAAASRLLLEDAVAAVIVERLIVGLTVLENGV